MHELTPEQIAGILNKPKKSRTKANKVRLSIPGTTKTRTVDISIRSTATWFHLRHSLKPCEGKDCIHGSRMCSEMPNGKWICRHCFIEGKEADEAASV